MLTREEIAEIVQYCKEKGVSYKSRLKEIGIAEWRFYESKRRYAEAQASERESGEFLQLVRGNDSFPEPGAGTGRMTRDMERVGRIAQPFRNYQIDFEPPRITAKPLMFGVDKWLDEQNRSIASRFVKIVCQIEALYRKDAKQQVQAVQRNALVYYQEFIDQLAELSVRERIFSIADVTISH